MWGRDACAARSLGTVLYLLSAAVAMTTTVAGAVIALLPFASSPYPPFALFLPSCFPPSFTAFHVPFPSCLDFYFLPFVFFFPLRRRDAGRVSPFFLLQQYVGAAHSCVPLALLLGF
ncbi:hypothetical protein XENOCAPTIV_024496 [Xenoophorus captivus]|uniref:Uncharacterized protein n=1 Tax=Xenoophorus captivus TaxID=1517983 RepID=A0ABV0QCA6_9TELE